MKYWQEKMDRGDTKPFSAYFIYNMRDLYDADRGMFVRNAMKVLHQVGVVSTEDYPVSKVDHIDIKRLSETLKQTAAQNRIAAYVRIHTLRGLKVALYKYGPCPMVLPEYSSHEQFWKPSARYPETDRAHCILVVGYNRDGFICRNSWGTAWGTMQGYFLLPYGDFGVHHEAWTAVDEITRDRHESIGKAQLPGSVNLHSSGVSPPNTADQGQVLAAGQQLVSDNADSSYWSYFTIDRIQRILLNTIQAIVISEAVLPACLELLQGQEKLTSDSSKAASASASANSPAKKKRRSK